MYWSRDIWIFSFHHSWFSPGGAAVAPIFCSCSYIGIIAYSRAYNALRVRCSARPAGSVGSRHPRRVVNLFITWQRLAVAQTRSSSRWRKTTTVTSAASSSRGRTRRWPSAALRCTRASQRAEYMPWGMYINSHTWQRLLSWCWKKMRTRCQPVPPDQQGWIFFLSFDVNSRIV